SRGESHASSGGVLQWAGVPLTGSPSEARAVARSKHLTKQLLRGAGLPTPDFFVVDALPVPLCSLDWPVIVKPCNRDASIGLSQASVVLDQEHLEAQVALVAENYGLPILVEEFIAGREIWVGVV